MNANEMEARFTETERALQAFGINLKDQMNAVKDARDGESLLDAGILYWKNGEPWFYSYIYKDELDQKADCVHIAPSRKDAKLIQDAFERAGFKTELIDKISGQDPYAYEAEITIVVKF